MRSNSWLPGLGPESVFTGGVGGGHKPTPNILLWGFLAEQQQVESWALPLRRPVFAEIETTQARRAEEATGARQQLASIRLGLGQW